MSEDERLDKYALDLAWIFTGIFHDFSYPLQQAGNWLSSFTTKFFPTKEIFFDIAIEKLLREEICLKKINCLSTLFNSINDNEDFVWNSKEHFKYKSNYYLNQIFYDRLTRFETKDRGLKSHALLSALSILTKFSHSTDVPSDKIQYVDRIVYPAALAISLHHLHPHGIDRNLKLLGEFFLSKNILTYLLIFSDSVQEWYRLEQDEAVQAKLVEFYFKKNTFTIKLHWTGGYAGPNHLQKHANVLKKHLSFLRAIPRSLLQNDIPKTLRMVLNVKTPWGLRPIYF